VAEEMAVPAASRANDSPPLWSGGGVIVSDAAEFGWAEVCSNGFNAINLSSGWSYNISAGHCFTGTGADVRDGTNSDHFGTVNYRAYGEFDGAAIHTLGGSDDVWADPTSAKRDITGSSLGDAIGVKVCYDGAVTLESCDAKIIATDLCLNYGALPHGAPATYVCHLVKTNGVHAGSGDSGGPVYTTTGSTQANATGIMSGYSSSFNTYTPIRIITTAWNLKVRCGAC